MLAAAAIYQGKYLRGNELIRNDFKNIFSMSFFSDLCVKETILE